MSKLRLILLKNTGIRFTTSHHIYIHVLESTPGTYECSILNHYGASSDTFSFSIDSYNSPERGFMSETSSRDDRCLPQSSDTIAIEIEIEIEDVKRIAIDETRLWKGNGGRKKGRMIVTIIYEKVNEGSVIWKEVPRYWNALRLERRYRWIRNGGLHITSVERLDEGDLFEKYTREGRLHGIGLIGKSKRRQVV